jgi:uncharacterized protein YggE
MLPWKKISWVGQLLSLQVVYGVFMKNDTMNPPQPVIRVKGQGRITSTPDVVILGLAVTSLHSKYGAAVSGLNKNFELLRNALTGVGVDPKELKTTSFNISIDYAYVKGRNVFRGFSGTHGLELRQPFEQRRLAQLFDAISASKANAQLTLAFTVSNPEEIKQRVLQDAVKNARASAECIAEAADQTLGSIVSIDYSWSEIRITSDSARFAPPLACASAPDLEPADFESEDTVQLAWEISSKPSSRRQST